MNNYNIVLDVNSGAIHVVDDLTFDILDMHEENISGRNIIDTYPKEEVGECIKEINELINRNLLFSKDTYLDSLEEIENREPVVKAMCFHVTHDCNLKCSYCFADEGEYYGSKSLMSFEVGKKALDFLIENSGNRRNLEVDFFGGEPLMNFEVVKKLVAYGREIEKIHNKNFRFTITTNGILLDEEKEQFINDNMQNVVLSLDGRKEINDKYRKTKNNQGSYDIVLSKYQRLIKNRIEKEAEKNLKNDTEKNLGNRVGENQSYEPYHHYIRGTFTRENLDFTKDVVHFLENGFRQISIEPVVLPDDNELAIKSDDIESINNEYENLALKIIDLKKEYDFNFFHFMIDLEGGPCVAKRLVGCGAGTEYLAVTPTGDLYPCHQFVGLEDFLLGNLETGITKKNLVEDFKNCNVHTKEDCRDCWAKFYCSGGCLSNAYIFNKDIYKPYEIGCELQKKRTECALMLKAEEYST